MVQPSAGFKQKMSNFPRFIKSFAWLLHDKWHNLPQSEPGSLSMLDIKLMFENKSKLTILEIGAHVGKDTINFAKAFPEACIYAFEPDPRNFTELSANVAQYNNVVPINIAVSSSNGVSEFNLSKTDIETFGSCHTESSSLMSPSLHKIMHPHVDWEVCQVRTITLDSFIKQFSIRSIDFIWADVQGAEGMLISGGCEALKITRFFYTEYGLRKIYAQQTLLPQLLGMLPQFTILRRFPCDILLQNKSIS